MKNVTIHEAKTNLSKLIKKATEGEDVVISRGSQAVVKLTPLAGPKGGRKPGSLKGKLRVGEDFFEPLPDEELGESGA